MNRIRAWISANPLVVDTALALLIATASVFGFVSGADRIDAPAAFTIGLLLLESLPLALRRRFPVGVPGRSARDPLRPDSGSGPSCPSATRPDRNCWDLLPVGLTAK